MARTEDSRRVEDAGHRDLGTDRLPASAEVAATAQPDLEDLPSQPSWSNGLDGLLHRAHDYDEGAVRVPGAGTSPSRGAAFQCHGASPGHPSRSSKPSPIRIRPGISFEIETASTATKFVGGSHHSRWNKCSPRPGVPGRVRTPNG